MPTKGAQGTRRRAAAVVLVMALAAVFTACGGNNNDATAGSTTQTVQDATQSAKDDAANAFAALRTQAERLVDQVKTSDAPQAKQKLLDQCRDALEKLRKANSDQADHVDTLCNRIRDTDVTNVSAWGDLKDEINKLNVS